jgi:hypothetical protein
LDRKGRLQLLRLDSAKPDDVTLYIGDSHVQQYWPRLTYLSHERSATINAIEFASYAGCAPLPGVNRIERDFKCPEFFQQAIEAAQSDKVKVVVFEGWWEWYFLPDSPGALHLVGDSSLRPLSLDSPEGSEVLRQFGDLLRRLVGSHKRVYIMLSNPTSPQFDPLSMVERVTYRLTPHESISRDEFEQRAGPIVNRVREVAIQAGATVVDPAEYLCDATRCPGVSPNGLPLFKDSNHLRASYARQQQYLDPFNF